MDKLSVANVKTVLLVDDNDDTRVLTKWFLDNFGYAVDSTPSAEEALSRFNPEVHDLILTDNSMPGMSGTELVKRIKLKNPTTPAVMFTGNPPQDCSGIDVVIIKPTNLLDVKETMDRLLAAKEAAG